MEEQELDKLQDIEGWEFERGERPAIQPARAIVSVAFSRADLAKVADEARRQGMKTSEFIRTAALSATEPSRKPAALRVHSITGSSNVKTHYAPSVRASTRSRKRGAQRWKEPIPTTT